MHPDRVARMIQRSQLGVEGIPEAHQIAIREESQRRDESTCAVLVRVWFEQRNQGPEAGVGHHGRRMVHSPTNRQGCGYNRVDPGDRVRLWVGKYTIGNQHRTGVGRDRERCIGEDSRLSAWRISVAIAHVCVRLEENAIAKPAPGAKERAKRPTGPDATAIKSVGLEFALDPPLSHQPIDLFDSKVMHSGHLFATRPRRQEEDAQNESNAIASSQYKDDLTKAQQEIA
jgi:hypothetical protein